MSNSFKGYMLGVLAAASYGTNPLFALPLLNAGIEASSVLFIRYMLAIPMLVIIMLVRGRSFGLKKNQWVPLITLGMLMAASSLLLYVSLHIHRFSHCLNVAFCISNHSHYNYGIVLS